jgi:hypothetical protein
MPQSTPGGGVMPNARDEKKTGKKEKVGGYKIRTTNDLLLISMVLDEDPVLRDRVVTFLEHQLGKRALIKVNDDRE